MLCTFDDLCVGLSYFFSSMQTCFSWSLPRKYMIW